MKDNLEIRIKYFWITERFLCLDDVRLISIQILGNLL